MFVTLTNLKEINATRAFELRIKMTELFLYEAVKHKKRRFVTVIFKNSQKHSVYMPFISVKKIGYKHDKRNKKPTWYKWY